MTMNRPVRDFIYLVYLNRVMYGGSVIIRFYNIWYFIKVSLICKKNNKNLLSLKLSKRPKSWLRSDVSLLLLRAAVIISKIAFHSLWKLFMTRFLIADNHISPTTVYYQNVSLSSTEAAIRLDSKNLFALLHLCLIPRICALELSEYTRHIDFEDRS